MANTNYQNNLASTKLCQNQCSCQTNKSNGKNTYVGQEKFTWNILIRLHILVYLLTSDLATVSSIQILIMFHLSIFLQDKFLGSISTRMRKNSSVRKLNSQHTKAIETCLKSHHTTLIFSTIMSQLLKLQKRN